ncbi:MAG TPA: DUF1203 domain-containing protein [Burkholderiales bacterium]|jgi:hypothetical protein|nr:DUF1203 domain-containing protein [Burkholderiales bacterium]
MNDFRLVGLASEPFAPLFEMSDEELAARSIRRVVADHKPGFPCRISLVDAEVGEELLLLPYCHQPADSPYQASGPIFIRAGARRRMADPSEIPPYVAGRLISARAYDERDFIVDADVCDGADAAAAIRRMFENPKVRYIHLHNAKRGCFSCRVERA